MLNACFVLHVIFMLHEFRCIKMSDLYIYFYIFQTTVAQWNCVFYIVAAFQVISGLIFVAFGSAELQSWGKRDDDSSTEVEKSELTSSENGIILKTRSFSSLSHASATKAKNKS